jgi:hypothetical protein
MSKCVDMQLELYHAFVLWGNELFLIGDQAQAGVRAATDAVMVCSPPLWQAVTFPTFM